MFKQIFNPLLRIGFDKYKESTVSTVESISPDQSGNVPLNLGTLAYEDHEFCTQAEYDAKELAGTLEDKFYFIPEP